MSAKLGNDWDELLKEEFKKDYYLNLREFLIDEYNTKTIYPDKEDIFNALKLTSFENTKVLILGQDPYHGKGQGHGLSFSVNKEIRVPPSLRNIYKELHDDIGEEIPNSGYLKKWAEQGVLLLNTALTVREKEPNSHKNMGWEIFTNRVIELLNEKEKPMVFILWGNNAKSKEELITNKNHLIIKSTHPSPFSAHRGFLGSKPFSRTNEFLKSVGENPIDWHIDDI